MNIRVWSWQCPGVEDAPVPVSLVTRYGASLQWVVVGDNCKRRQVIFDETNQLSSWIDDGSAKI